MNTSTNQPARHQGLTLVELLVVIAIIGVLVALLLPSMRTGREAQRRMSCGNNFQQIGVALQNYHQRFQHLPPALGGTGQLSLNGNPASPQTNLGRLSGLVASLPLVEQAALYEEIQSPTEPGPGGQLYASMGPVPWESHFTPWTNEIPVYRCPSDPAKTDELGLTNYTFCIGDHLVDVHRADNPRGVFAGSLTRSFDEITDGTGNTIAMAEISTDLGDRGLQGQYAIDQPIQYLIAPDHTTELCDAERPSFYNDSAPLSKQGRGSRWADGSAGYSLVNTVLPPNSPSVAINGDELADGLYSASSRHMGGCHVLLADGAVSFITDTIDCGQATRTRGPKHSPMNDNVTGDDQAIQRGQTIAEAPLTDVHDSVAGQPQSQLDRLRQPSNTASRFGIWGALGTATADDKVDPFSK